ncbi:MAG: hypothetical protein NTW86_10305, partial [Candidatus Sumerlaeota bacterium]|nr:hypothetical protein [Candidatus Sumerlaeota bacterium]
MPYAQLDRFRVKMKPLSSRKNKTAIEKDHVPPTRKPRHLPDPTREVIHEAAERIRQAQRDRRPVMLSFGAHTIKNGLAPVLIRLMERGWLTHLATNGAGIIHDWEFAYQGQSAED